MDVRALLASPVGFLIGLSLGALGGGGSILAVPALVYVAGQTPTEATASSLVVVGVTALIGVFPHYRAGNVRLAAGAIFGIAGVGGSIVGSLLNDTVDPDVLLLAFAGVMLVSAAGMWRRANRATTPAAPVAPRSAGAAADRAAPQATTPGSPAGTTPGAVDAGTVLRVLVAGTLVGFLTGFFGVGGGFVIVPALVMALRFPMPVAVGTSLLVIGINTAMALAVRLSSGAASELQWDVIVPFTLASVAGMVVGTRIATRVRSERLMRAFVMLLVAVAVYTAIQSVLALA